VIEAIDLTVRRRDRIVLDAVGFDVRPGQVTGVLGGTGAGKTTLLRRMVELERGGGETLFDGRPYRSLRHPMREVGVFLEPGVGHPLRTVRGHLNLVLATDRRAAREGNGAVIRRSSTSSALRPERTGFGAAPDDSMASDWHGPSGHDGSTGRWRRLGDRLVVSRNGTPVERIDAVLDIVGLTEQADTRLADLTAGMATRLGIAVALLGDPNALLLDAPERGLEPEGVAWLGSLLRAFTGQGRAALVTGSDTETLVGLADRLLLLDSGYLVGTRTAEEVLRAPTGAAVIVRSPQIVRFAAILAESGARSAHGEGACLEVRGLDRARVGDLAYRHGIPVHELSERFTGSDPGDVVLAACSARSRPVVPFQAFPETASEISGILARIVAAPLPEPESIAALSATAESWSERSWTERSWGESSGPERSWGEPSGVERSEVQLPGAERAGGELFGADLSGPELIRAAPFGAESAGSGQSPPGELLSEAEPHAMAESLSTGDAPSTQTTEVGR
jgi:ABC-type multidrug transport system ATPase subunit